MRFVVNYENLETDLTTLANKIDFEKSIEKFNIETKNNHPVYRSTDLNLNLSYLEDFKLNLKYDITNLTILSYILTEIYLFL